jgi:hypothetical protein
LPTPCTLDHTHICGEIWIGSPHTDAKGDKKYKHKQLHSKGSMDLYKKHYPQVEYITKMNPEDC